MAKTKKYMVRTGSLYRRGKSHFCETLDEAITKAMELQKKRKDHRRSYIFEGTLYEDGCFEGHEIEY